MLAKRIELAGLPRNGCEFPVGPTISPSRLRSEYAFNALLRYISEREQAEQAQAQLAAIIDSSDDAIIGKDLGASDRAPTI